MTLEDRIYCLERTIDLHDVPIPTDLVLKVITAKMLYINYLDDLAEWYVSQVEREFCRRNIEIFIPENAHHLVQC